MSCHGNPCLTISLLAAASNVVQQVMAMGNQTFPKQLRPSWSFSLARRSSQGFCNTDGCSTAARQVSVLHCEGSLVDAVEEGFAAMHARPRFALSFSKSVYLLGCVSPACPASPARMAQPPLHVQGERREALYLACRQLLVGSEISEHVRRWASGPAASCS